jgi:hypothetical protein
MESRLKSSSTLHLPYANFLKPFALVEFPLLLYSSFRQHAPEKAVVAGDGCRIASGQKFNPFIYRSLCGKRRDFAIANSSPNTMPHAFERSEHKCSELPETEDLQPSLFLHQVTTCGYPTAVFQVPKGQKKGDKTPTFSPLFLRPPNCNLEEQQKDRNNRITLYVAENSESHRESQFVLFDLDT